MQAPLSHSYLRGFFDNLSTGVLIADDSARYVDANRVACELLGRPLASVVGLHVSDVVAPGRAAEVNLQWQAFLRDGSQSGIFTLALADGSPREIQFEAHAHFLPGLHFSIIRPMTAAHPDPAPGTDAGLLTLCAWTKRVYYKGEWITIEDYLHQGHGLRVTHSISPQAFSKELSAMRSPPDPLP